MISGVLTVLTGAVAAAISAGLPLVLPVAALAAIVWTTTKGVDVVVYGLDKGISKIRENKSININAELLTGILKLKEDQIKMMKKSEIEECNFSINKILNSSKIILENNGSENVVLVNSKIKVDLEPVNIKNRLKEVKIMVEERMKLDSTLLVLTRDLINELVKLDYELTVERKTLNSYKDIVDNLIENRKFYFREKLTETKNYRVTGKDAMSNDIDSNLEEQLPKIKEIIGVLLMQNTF